MCECNERYEIVIRTSDIDTQIRSFFDEQEKAKIFKKVKVEKPLEELDFDGDVITS